MRKCIALLLVVSTCFSLGACSKPKAAGDDNIIVVPNTEAYYISEVAATQHTGEQVEVFRNGTDGIDIDITVLSSTMVYSVVYCMVLTPQDYLGMVVKMNGQFSYYYDEYTGNEYYTCIIQDATACCAQGIEFIPTDDYTYPDDFPEAGEDITVIGTFDAYIENGITYCTLREATICAD